MRHGLGLCAATWRDVVDDGAGTPSSGDRRGRLEVAGLKRFSSPQGRETVEDFTVVRLEQSSRPRDRPDDRRPPPSDEKLLPIAIWRLGGPELVAF